MAKSIQDLCIYMNQLSSALARDDLSVEIYTDKTFRIWGTKDDEAICLYDSDEGLDRADINDLPYIKITELAKEIQDNLSVADIKAGDL